VTPRLADHSPRRVTALGGHGLAERAEANLARACRSPGKGGRSGIARAARPSIANCRKRQISGPAPGDRHGPEADRSRWPCRLGDGACQGRVLADATERNGKSPVH
jgi:hypothetical protein